MELCLTVASPEHKPPPPAGEALVVPVVGATMSDWLDPNVSERPPFLRPVLLSSPSFPPSSTLTCQMRSSVPVRHLLSSDGSRMFLQPDHICHICSQNHHRLVPTDQSGGLKIRSDRFCISIRRVSANRRFFFAKCDLFLSAGSTDLPSTCCI